MKKQQSSVAVLAFAGALAFSGLASADTYVEAYTCKTEEGKTVKDVQAANGKWLAWVNSKSDVEVTSDIGTAIVGDNQIFLFVDTYPSLSAWAKVQEMLDSEEAEELEKLFEGISECSENRLWKMEPTKAS